MPRSRTVLTALAAAAAVLLAGMTANALRSAEPAAESARATPTTPPPPADRAAVEAAVRNWLARSGVPGVVVGLQSPGGPPLLVAAGDADPEGRWPLSPEHRFRIGSVTKTFVAATALQLAEEGRLDLDTQARRHVPLLSERPGITIRHLLAHRSGLAEARVQPEFLAATRPRLDRTWAPEEVIGFALKSPAEFAPGERYAYRGTNYLVLGLVIEAVTGRPLREVLRERLLDPLALDATALPTAEEVPVGLAVGRSTAWSDALGMPVVDTASIPHQAIASTAWAEGAMVSDAADLLRWALALYGGDVLSPGMRARMTSPVGDSGYGLGTLVGSGPLGRELGHGGIYVGYRTELRYLPGRQLAVVALATADDAELALLYDDLVEVLGPPAGGADATENGAIAALRSSDPRQREKAAFALGQARDPDEQMVRALAAALIRDDSARVRTAAALALGFAGVADRDTALRALRQALDDPDPAVRAAAERALGVLAEPARAADG